MTTHPTIRSGAQPNPPAAPATPGRWSVLPAASTAVFSVRELGLRRVRGSFPVVDGVVDVDATGRPVSVRASLDAAGIATGDRRRDAGVRGPRFLATDQWPALSFTSREVSGDGSEWTVTGTLQVRDVRSPMTLAVRLAGSDPDGSRHAVATATLDRRVAGVGRMPAFVIPRTVEVTLDVTLTPAG